MSGQFTKLELTNWSMRPGFIYYAHNYSCIVYDVTSVCYCLICASVREDNRRVFPDGISPVQTQNHTRTC